MRSMYQAMIVDDICLVLFVVSIVSIFSILTLRTILQFSYVESICINLLLQQQNVNRTGEVYYKHKKPAYLQEGYEAKPKSKESLALEEENKRNFEVASTRVWFHLSGIEASEQEPFVLSVKGQTVFRYSKRIGKRQQFPVYIKKEDAHAKHHIIDLQIDIPMLGIEGATQSFNLHTNGQQIMIAVIDDGTNVKILQADSRDKLPNYDDQYKKWDDVVVAYEKKSTAPSTSTSSTSSSSTSTTPSKGSNASSASGGKFVPVFFYASNIPASAQEPFRISVNGQRLYESKRNISSQEIVSSECELPPPATKGADHVILVRYEISSRGVDFEQEFNLTRNGAYIMIKLSDESGEERVSLQQQHKNVYGGAAADATPAIARPRKDSSPLEIDTVNFYLNNIPASSTQPFELLVNGQPFYHTTDDMSVGEKRNQIVAFEGRLPRPRTGDHVVQFIVKAPMVTREQVSVDFNLTKDGKFVKVFIDGQKKIHVLQSTDDKFEEPVGTEPADGYIKELEMLASLYEGGILTKDEFEQKKRKVLGL